ncbi:MAG: YDG domain-containing protein, partial [Verrucomicrobiota bacterium]
RVLGLLLGGLTAVVATPVTLAQSQLVAVGENGTILTSPDGATWTSRGSGTVARLRAATVMSGTLIVVGQAGTVLTRPDGLTWTSIPSGITEGLRGVAASASRAVAVGGQTTGRIFTSPDAVTWTEAILAAPAGALRGIAFDGTRFAAVGASGSILTSVDGATWVPRTSGTVERLDGIVWTGSAFEVISNTGKFLRSTDGGATWSAPVAGNAPAWIEGMVWSPTRVVTVGAGGRIRTSDDGLNWTWRTSGVAGVIHGVTFTGTITAQTLAAVTFFGGLRKLTVKGLTAANKTYTGTSAAVVSGTPALDLVAGEDVTLSGSVAAGTFASAGVANGIVVTADLSGLSVGGADAGNYTGITSALTANLTAAALTVTAGADTKVYGGTRTYGAAATAFTSSGLVNGETIGSVTLTASGGTAATDRARAYDLTPSAATGGTFTAANYAISYVKGTLTVTPVALTLTADGKSRAYGAANPSATYVLSGFVNGETEAGLRALTPAALSGTPALTYAGTATAAAAANSPHAITAAAGTLAADNYTFTAGTNGTLTITAASLTGTFTAADKVYDGTATANVTARNLTGVVGADSVQLTGGTASFGSKDKGPAKTVTLTGATLAGAQAANYTLASVSTTTANVTAKAVTVTGVTAANKTYDGNATATPAFGAAALGGVIPGDTATLVTAGATATFADKAVGAGKTVTLAGLTLTGADAGNYSLTQPTTTASITAKSLTVANARALDTIYDGSTVAALNRATAQHTGVVAGEPVTLVPAGATGAFADANAGENKPVTVSGLSLGGADAAGYALTPPSPPATISRRGVVFTLTGLEQAYNGTARRVTATAFPQVSFGIAYAAAGGQGLVTPVNAGRYTVTVSAADPNHTGQLTETLVITKGRQTLALTAPASATLAAPAAVSATASSGLPVTLSATGPATLNQGLLTFQTPGTAVVTARQAGDANWEEATATASVTVAGKLAQTIAFPVPADQLANNPPLTLAATASSGLPVTYTLVSGPALLSGNRVTLRGDAGTGNAMVWASLPATVTEAVAVASSQLAS